MGRNNFGYNYTHRFTTQKTEFFMKDFFNKCKQICCFLQICSHLVKKASLEKFIFSYIELNYYLTEILPNTQPETTTTQNISDKEEDEITLSKRHKKYFQDVERITSAIWCRNREYESLDVIRDMNFFMSRYSTSGRFVSTCDGCASPLPWQKYRCLDCFDLDLCGGCYLCGKRPDGHLNTHKTVELR